MISGRASGSGERVELCAAIVFAGLPLRGDPALLFELVQGGVEGAVADLQDVAGDLLQTLADGPAVHGLKGENLQEKKVECALDQIRWLAHGLSSVTEGMIHNLPSVSKGKGFQPPTRGEPFWVPHFGHERVKKLL